MKKSNILELTIPVRSSVWGTLQHKPLLMHISFPLCTHPPWSLKIAGRFVEFYGELHIVPETVPGRAGAPLRKDLRQLLQSLPKDAVRNMLPDPHWSSFSHPES
jgi:hypothetical protein